VARNRAQLGHEQPDEQPKIHRNQNGRRRAFHNRPCGATAKTIPVQGSIAERNRPVRRRMRADTITLDDGQHEHHVNVSGKASVNSTIFSQPMSFV